MSGKCENGSVCATVADLRDETLINSERLRVAAERGEKMVKSFEECLASIQTHQLSFTEGRAVMERQQLDTNNLAAEMRRHSLDKFGAATTHTELQRDLRRLSGAIAGVIIAVGVLYSVVLTSPLGQKLLDALGRWLGVI